MADFGGVDDTLPQGGLQEEHDYAFALDSPLGRTLRNLRNLNFSLQCGPYLIHDLRRADFLLPCTMAMTSKHLETSFNFDKANFLELGTLTHHLGRTFLPPRTFMGGVAWADFEKILETLEGGLHQLHATLLGRTFWSSWPSPSSIGRTL